VDWVKFVVAQQPLTYTIWTAAETGWLVDTILTLYEYYDTNDISELWFNDDDLTNPPFSRITWPFTATGTYFAKAAHRAGAGGWCVPDYYYKLAIITSTNSTFSSPPEGVASLSPGLAHSVHHLPMLWERTDIFLPVYRKEWDGLKRFRP